MKVISQGSVHTCMHVSFTLLLCILAFWSVWHDLPLVYASEFLFIYLFFPSTYCCNQEMVEQQAPGLMKEAERFLTLSNIDRLWKEHLQAIKFVQQAVSLRGYAQRDPLIEYKLEGYNLFLEMMAQIRRNVIYAIYQVRMNEFSPNFSIINVPSSFNGRRAYPLFVQLVDL